MAFACALAAPLPHAAYASTRHTSQCTLPAHSLSYSYRHWGSPSPAAALRLRFCLVSGSFTASFLRVTRPVWHIDHGPSTIDQLPPDYAAPSDCCAPCAVCDAPSLTLPPPMTHATPRSATATAEHSLLCHLQIVCRLLAAQVRAAAACAQAPTPRAMLCARSPRFSRNTASPFAWCSVSASRRSCRHIPDACVSCPCLWFCDVRSCSLKSPDCPTLVLTICFALTSRIRKTLQ